jgi:hypothetical protein
MPGFAKSDDDVSSQRDVSSRRDVREKRRIAPALRASESSQGLLEMLRASEIARPPC